MSKPPQRLNEVLGGYCRREVVIGGALPGMIHCDFIRPAGWFFAQFLVPENPPSSMVRFFSFRLLLGGRVGWRDYTGDVFQLRFQDEIPRASLKLPQKIRVECLFLTAQRKIEDEVTRT